MRFCEFSQLANKTTVRGDTPYVLAAMVSRWGKEQSNVRFHRETS